MSPADNTPDFDSMSPEELMAWMESLAKRQGATEGFTTAADMQVAEVDPSTVSIDEPGYVPYGMDPDKWKAQQEAEKAAKAAQRTVTPPAPPPTVPVPAVTPVAAPPPAPVQTPAAASAAPDFDSMSPEELMAWMESLAKRQGATEGFTTAADMQVAEVDPSTVSIDEPGYVPYGMDPDKWKAQQEAEKAAKPAAPPPAPKPVTPPAPEPVPAMPQFELPQLPADEDMFSTEVAAPAKEPDAMSWLESLAADQSPNFPSIDLSSLGAELEPLSTAVEPAASGGVDPMSWLESLAQSQEEEMTEILEPPAAQPPAPPPQPEAAPAAEVTDPLAGGVDPLAWLETLARRQGASTEELATEANLDIPVPPEEAPVSEAAPGYSEYSFEETDSVAAADFLKFDDMEEEEAFSSADLDNPEDWLDALATGRTFTPEPPAPPKKQEPSIDIVEAIRTGQDISPEDMQAWMEKQFDIAEQLPEEPEEVADENAPPIKAELPDWLIEQMGTPPPPAETAPAPEAPVFEEAVEPPAVEMPDWLQVEEPEAFSVESIFATADEEQEVQEVAAVTPTEPPVILMPSTEEMAIETSDPWVEAFELERTEGMSDIESVPEWYAERLAEPVQPPAPVIPAQPAVPLAEAVLEPETELVPGEPEAVPEWIADITPDWVEAVSPTEEEQPALQAEIPDWLRESVGPPAETAQLEELPDWLRQVETTVEPAEIPDWLKETHTEEQPVTAAPPPPPAPAPAPVIPPPPPKPMVSPVPVPPAAAAIDVAAILTDARSKAGSGDLEGSLQDYEAVIRANTQLETVVADLSKLVEDKVHKENPAVYRVLGDGLMRQGKLQAALDTYRKALNLL